VGYLLITCRTPEISGAALQPIAGKPGSHRDRTRLESRTVPTDLRTDAVPVGAWLAGDGPQSGPKISIPVHQQNEHRNPCRHQCLVTIGANDQPGQPRERQVCSASRALCSTSMTREAMNLSEEQLLQVEQLKAQYSGLLSDIIAAECGLSPTGSELPRQAARSCGSGLASRWGAKRPQNLEQKK